MTTTKLIKTAVLGLALTMFACDGGKDAGKKGTDKNVASKKTPDEPNKPEPEPEVEAPSLDPKVEQAVTIANKISAQPDAADTILEEAGMDREAFEKLLYEIARDPELSKSYAIAREA
jgi:hypothetical protein